LVTVLWSLGWPLPGAYIGLTQGWPCHRPNDVLHEGLEARNDPSSRAFFFVAARPP